MKLWGWLTALTFAAAGRAMSCGGWGAVVGVWRGAYTREGREEGRPQLRPQADTTQQVPLYKQESLTLEHSFSD